MPDFTTRPEILGTFGVVASTHWLATATGMAILERGGNAFDAAAAAGFALQVVEPHLNGPGGDLPIILYSAGKDAVEVICGQGVAPTGGDGRDLSGTRARPGAGDRTARRRGARRLRCLAADAARSRHAAAARRARAGDRLRAPAATPWCRRSAPRSSASGTCSTPSGRPRLRCICRAATYRPRAALFRNPALADTYERILGEAEGAGPDREAQIEAARRAWYRGFVAEAIDRFCRHNEVLDVTGRRHRGLLTADDLARLAGEQSSHRSGATITATPCARPGRGARRRSLCSSLLCSRASILPASRPPNPAFVHVVVECAKLAFADREAFYGDPNFVEVPTATLLSDAYNDQRRSLIGEEASRRAAAGADRRLRRRRAAALMVERAGHCPCRGARRHRRADRPPRPAGRRGAWRHLPRGRHRSPRQHGRGDAVWRLAAELAGDPGARLLPRYARPDVLAGREPPERSRPGQAAPDHAVPFARAAGRAGLHGVRHARRRPAGPMGAARVPAPRALRHEPAGGDRRARVPHRARAELVLSARGAPRPRGAGGPVSAGDAERAPSPRPRRGGGATAGAWAGSAPPPGTARY